MPRPKWLFRVLSLLLVGLAVVALSPAAPASAVWHDPYNTEWEQSDASYTVPMPTSFNNERFEVQPGDPSKNSITLPGSRYRIPQARLKLTASYIAGLGYYSFNVDCLRGSTWVYQYSVINRGGFIPDYNRPFVGVFYQPDGNVVMYKYAKDSAGNPVDKWVVGELGTWRTVNGLNGFSYPPVFYLDGSYSIGGDQRSYTDRQVDKCS